MIGQEFLVKKREDLLKKVYNNDVVREFTNKYKSYVTALCSKENVFKYDKNDSLVIAQKVEYGDKQVLRFDYFILGQHRVSKEKVLEIIESAKNYFSIQEIEVAIQLYGDQYKELDVLKKLDYLPFAITTLGKTEDLCKLFGEVVGFEVRQANLNDFENIYKTEMLAHISSKDNRIDFDDSNTRKMMENMYKEMIAKGTAFLLIESESGNVIGVTGVMPNNSYKTGFLASVAIVPDFQGRGLSKLLYKKIYDTFNMHKDIYYRTITTSSLILNIAKKSNREVLDYTMVKTSS